MEVSSSFAKDRTDSEGEDCDLYSYRNNSIMNFFVKTFLVQTTKKVLKLIIDDADCILQSTEMIRYCDQVGIFLMRIKHLFVCDMNRFL